MPEKQKLPPPPIKISRKMLFIARAVLLIVFILWIAGIFYFYSRIQETERQIEALKQRKQQQEELLRRQAIYQRAVLEQETATSGVQNAVDAFKQ